MVRFTAQLSFPASLMIWQVYSPAWDLFTLWSSRVTWLSFREKLQSFPGRISFVPLNHFRVRGSLPFTMEEKVTLEPGMASIGCGGTTNDGGSGREGNHQTRWNQNLFRTQTYVIKQIILHKWRFKGFISGMNHKLTFDDQSGWSFAETSLVYSSTFVNPGVRQLQGGHSEHAAVVAERKLAVRPALYLLTVVEPRDGEGWRAWHFALHLCSFSHGHLTVLQFSGECRRNRLVCLGGQSEQFVRIGWEWK